MKRERVIEIVQIWHGLNRDEAAKYVDALIARGDRTIRIHHELVDIEP
jgi:tRNA G26 N,N-dimethylase Trm1